MVEKVHKFRFHCPSVCFEAGKEEKLMRIEEKNFHTYKTRFCFSIWTLPTFEVHNFFVSSSF